MFHKKKQNIILTADDFGKSDKANRNILALAKIGKLDRVSVMAEGNFALGEIEKIISTGVKLDIHFELEWQKKRRGKMKDNTMWQGVIFLINYFCAGQRKKVWRDWKKQVEKFHEITGRYPDGVNSHEYVHFFPSYFKIAVELAKQFEILTIRFGKKGFRGKINLAHLVLNNLRRWDKKYFFVSGLDSSDYFASLDWIENLEGFLKNNSQEKIELACHPERDEEYDLINNLTK